MKSSDKNSLLAVGKKAFFAREFKTDADIFSNPPRDE